MKKYIVGVLAICMLFVLAGCGKTKSESKSIVGKWTLDNVQNGPVTITFNKDNTVVYENKYFSETGTYRFTEDNILVIEGIWDEEELYEYVLENGTLTLEAKYLDSMSYPNMKKVK